MIEDTFNHEVNKQLNDSGRREEEFQDGANFIGKNLIKKENEQPKRPLNRTSTPTPSFFSALKEVIVPDRSSKVKRRRSPKKK